MNENLERSPLERTRWRLEFALHLHVCCAVYMQVECTSCGAAILNLVSRLPERLGNLLVADINFDIVAPKTLEFLDIK